MAPEEERTMVAWLLVGHILGLVLWISGLLGTGIATSRLAQESSAEARYALVGVQRTSLRALADPGALIAILFGVWLIASNPSYFLGARWLHIKLGFVAILIVLHVTIAIRGKTVAVRGATADGGQAKVLTILVVLVMISILIATLPGAVYLR
jgi:putative membrane protein